MSFCRLDRVEIVPPIFVDVVLYIDGSGFINDVSQADKYSVGWVSRSMEITDPVSLHEVCTGRPHLSHSVLRPAFEHNDVGRHIL